MFACMISRGGWKTKGILLFMLIFSALYLAGRFWGKLVYVEDESVKPFRLFLIETSFDSHVTPEEKIKFLKKWAYVRIEVPKWRDKFAGGKSLVKRIMCMPGEVIKVVQEKRKVDYYCCDGKECIFLHSALFRTPKGTPLHPFFPCEKDQKVCMFSVPHGRLYLGTQNPYGYDSRYMGFFKTDYVDAVLKPFF